MTPISAADAALLPLTTDADIVERITDLIGPAARRQVWVLFLDDVDTQLPVLIPIEGYPRWPHDEAVALADFVADAAREASAASVLVVWERPGPSSPAAEDAAWARGLAVAFAHTDLTLRGQLISHGTGVRWLAPDDFV